MSYVLLFSEIKPMNLEIVGLKAGTLASIFAKQKVPSGFVMTTIGYKYFLENTKIKEKISESLSRLKKDNTQEIANEIQKLIVETSFPEELSSMIIESYLSLETSENISVQELLNAKEAKANVAIRSSYNYDLKDIEQLHLSILNIKGENNLLTAIKLVFAAEYTAKNLAHRKESGKNLESNISVIVQKMINADKSIFVYTADSSDIIIKAVFGLGEGLSDKNIVCDEYKVEKVGLKIKEISVKKQSRKYEIGKNGKIEKISMGNIGKIQKLSETEIIKAVKISNEFSADKILEIAVASEDFYIIDVKDNAKFKEKDNLKIEVYETTPLEDKPKSNEDESIKEEFLLYDSLEPEIERKQMPLKKTESDIGLKPKQEYRTSFEKAEEGVVNYDEEDDLKEEFEKEEYKVYEEEIYPEEIKRKVILKTKKKKEDDEEKTYYEPEESYDEKEDVKESDYAEIEHNKKTSKDKTKDDDDERYEDKKADKKINKDSSKDKSRDDYEDEDDSIFSSLKTY